MNRILILLVVLIASGSVLAKGEPKMSALEGSFLEQKAAIEKDIKRGLIYKGIAEKDLQQVAHSLERMSVLIEGITDYSDLQEDDKVDLINNQNLVNTILTMAENDNMIICTRRGTTGSHFKTTTCETRGNRRKRQEADRMAISDLLRQAYSGPE